MSRHRDVRNLNLDDELDDDALSDGGEEEMSEKDQAALEAAFEQVISVIGDSNTTGLSDKQVKAALWDAYFDVEETIEWALGEQERRHLAQVRKGEPLLTLAFSSVPVPRRTPRGRLVIAR
ncbi:hypothetical protein BDZ89DRAFT_100825 [Hymenopellis radicata]|nr:hypothetical protein BDZ89DRAFT_100825 [Hymenopellis radicata]